MGSRDRRAYRGLQEQQRFGQGLSGGGQRVSIPAPVTMNTRDNPENLPPTHAPLLEDVIPADGGLKVIERPFDRAKLQSSSAGFAGNFITYYGSGSGSAECWVQAAGKLHRIGPKLDSPSNPVATASVDTAAGAVANGDWVEFNKTIIFVTGGGGSTGARKWTRASSWTTWAPTVSAADSTSAGNFWGIAKFKNRLFAWQQYESIVYYGSTDQIEGTLNPFDLGGVITGNLRSVVTMPRDGGAGPDDYVAFISENGDVAVYAGTDPADANAWSLVGVYKIGKPVSRNAHFTYGQQTVVMCEDDFYFLPEDLMGKKSATVAAEYRKSDTNSINNLNAVFSRKEGKVVFSDGSVLDPKRGWAYSTITLSSAEPHKVRSDPENTFGGGAVSRPTLGEYKGKIYTLAKNNPNASASADLMAVREVFPSGAFYSFGLRKRKSRIRTAPIKTQGRTNISLVNPVFGYKPAFTASADLAVNLVYKTAVDYDNYRQPYATASSELLVTSTASTNSDGLWTPGYGTGDSAQIYIETVSATANADIYLYKIDLIAEDTGGL